jgi:hypothetical protein
MSTKTPQQKAGMFWEASIMRMRTRTSLISLKIATFEIPQLFCFLGCAQNISARSSSRSQFVARQEESNDKAK